MLEGDTGGSGGGLTGGTGSVLGGTGGGTAALGTGGKGTGGMVGTGGKSGTGGTVGGNVGGSGGNPAGGTGSGGSPRSGGTTGAGGVTSGTGGASTGGASTGGASTGGASTGGSVTSTGGTQGSGGNGNTIGGLIGHWTFDENSGTTAADSSGHNHSLTTSGATLGMAGKTGNGLKLAGAGVASASFSLGTLNAMTVGLWVKSTAASYADPGVGLFEFSDSSLVWDSNPFVLWTVGDDSGGDAPPSGSWHHLGASWDTTGAAVLCLDGVGIADITSALMSPITGSHQLSIGRLAADTAGFNGVIDDVRIYDHVLTCAEIYAAAQ